MNVLKKTWDYFRPYNKILALAFFMGLVVTALNMVNPYVTRLIFDKVIYGKRSELLIPFLMVMIIQTIVKQGIQYIRSYIIEKYSQKVNIALRSDAFKKFLSLTHSYFNKEKTGELMVLLSNDIEIVKSFITMTIPAAVEMLISFVFASTILFTMNAELTLAC